jgi:hypothetical protein
MDVELVQQKVVQKVSKMAAWWVQKKVVRSVKSKAPCWDVQMVRRWARWMVVHSAPQSDNRSSDLSDHR